MMTDDVALGLGVGMELGVQCYAALGFIAL
jgi:hypothetical protein